MRPSASEVTTPVNPVAGRSLEEAAKALASATKIKKLDLFVDMQPPLEPRGFRFKIGFSTLNFALRQKRTPAAQAGQVHKRRDSYAHFKLFLKFEFEEAFQEVRPSGRTNSA
jgi:hypothetical protein